MNKLQGKVAVITGGSSGIGLATAKRFVEEGAYVFITGRREKELAAAVEAIGRNVTAVRGDVAKIGDVDRLFATVKAEKGHLDIVFANAGTGSFGALGGISEEQYDTTFDVNVKGTLLTVQQALPLLRDGGSVILNASIVASKGFPAFSIYSASKAAIRSFARTWSVDLKARRIRVNALSPGVIPTPGYSDSLGMSQEQVEQFVQGATSGIPIARAGTPEEIAKAALFLASDESSYVSGIELFVDGGLAQI